MGLFAEAGRLVLVDGVERWKAPDAKAVAEYLAAPAPGTVLALVADEIRKDSPLAKACAKAGAVLAYEVSKRELPKWVAEQFARHEVKVSPEACRALVELAGDNPHELAGEIDKLALWADADEIGEDEIELLVAARADAPPWTLTDAWGARDVGGVLRATERMLDRTGDPVSRVIPRLVGSLTNHVRRARQAHRFDEQGVTAAEAASKLGIKPYPAQKLYAQVHNFSAAELDAALVRLADLDEALKGGSRLANELELERALVEITAAA